MANNYKAFKDNYIAVKRSQIESALMQLFSQFAPLQGKLEFKDKETFKQEIDKNKLLYLTIDELRAMDDLPPLPNGAGARLLNDVNAPVAKPQAAPANPATQPAPVQQAEADAEAEKKKGIRKLTAEDYEQVKHLGHLGVTADDFDVVEEMVHNRQRFSTESDIADYIIANDIKGLTIDELVDVLKKEGGIKTDTSELRDVLQALKESGLAEVDIDRDGRIKVTPVPKADVPDTDKVTVMYKYKKRPNIKGTEIIEGTRSFCEKLITNNRLYTREDIGTMSAIFGYDIYQFTGDASGWFFEGGLTPINSASQGNISPLANDNYTISASLNGLTVYGTISATTYYGNGANLTGIATGPGGSDTQIQYNNSGILTGLGTSDTAAVRIENPEAFSTLFITPSTSSLGATTGFFAGTGNGFLIYPQARQALRALYDRVYVFGDSDAGNFGVGTNNPTAKLHVLGNSILGGGVSAVTITATTFYGGTVSTLINNFTGLTVNGIISATTLSATTLFGNGANITGIVFPIEVLTTGGTFNNNTLVYTNNTGGTVSTLINNFTGLTVNGSISAVTISATTFFGNGGNLTGLPTFTDSYFTGGTYSAGTLTLRNNTGTTISISGFSTGGTSSASIDSYVTGGTYSNGVITFTNNTGTTFNVTGLFTGSTDSRITGGTFSNNILTLTNNTGGTVSTVINNFTGLTVNGIISATTISASTFVGNGAGLTGVIGSNERITGGTFTNNSLTLTNTTGGTVSTTINNFTGVTVNGLLSAATITASTLSVAGNVNEAFNGIIVGSYCHVEGNNTSANGSYAHAEGFQSNAIGDYTHAEGGATQSSGTYSHAEGVFSIASGQGSHAEGYSTTANINGAHAEGSGTTASGQMSHSEGSGTTASGLGAHAEGLGTIAAGNNQHVQGTYNNSNTTALMIIGNGTSAAARADLAIFNQSTIVFNKPVGLSVQVPLASLHITGGTTTVAPMILASGTTLLTPINGTVEYNGSNLFFTPTGATRQTVIVGQTGTTPVTTGSVNTWLAVSINGIQYKIPMYK
ncbi:Hep/Hag repeat protein [Ostertagia ostertagi]